MEQKNNSSYTYDAVIVLGMNIKATAEGYRPATYKDHDEFGMLGGEINVIAASLVHEHQLTDTFVFSTGTSEKTKAAFGPDVPTEAEVYAEDFLRRISRSSLPAPDIILEKNSVNTYSNLTECIGIIRHNEWAHVAIMSARYHIPRVKALWKRATQKYTVGSDVTFLTAENVVQRYPPRRYDQEIEAAYTSEQGQKRLKNEAQGLDDMQTGKYVITEFQLMQGKLES